MKKDRNCGFNNYSQAIPIMGMPQQFMMSAQPAYAQPTYVQPTYPQAQSSSYNVEQQINSLKQQVNNLENRVSKLEGANTTTNNYSNKYNDSNYYML